MRVRRFGTYVVTKLKESFPNEMTNMGEKLQNRNLNGTKRSSNEQKSTHPDEDGGEANIQTNMKSCESSTMVGKSKMGENRKGAETWK